MNRLVKAHVSRGACVAALWLLATSTASAQIQMPAGSVPANPSAVPDRSETGVPSDTASLAAGQKWLADARQAMSSADFHRTVQSFRKAAAVARTTPALANDVEKMRRQLKQLGMDEALLALPPEPSNQIKPMPAVSGASPVASANPANRKQEALRLVAIGRSALDRGDVTTALAAARQAEALNVPETDFRAGEPRVWQLLLDAESAARRGGIALTSGNEAPVAINPVQTAGGTNAPPSRVAQMLFNADANSAGNVQQVQSTLPATQGNYAEEKLNEGLQALGAGDTAAAREKFREAWKFESQLNPAQRSQLKDKLTLLQPSRIGTSAPQEAPMTPIQRADMEAKEKTRRLFREVTAELAKSEQIKVASPLDALDQLERLRRRVDGADVDDASRRSIAMMVDRSILNQKKYIEANRAEIDLELQNDSIRTELANEQAQNAAIDEEIAALVSTFNSLMKERRYQEAEVVAKQVQDLKPGAPIAINMHQTSRLATRIAIAQEISDAKERSFVDYLNDVDRAAVGPADPRLPMTLPNAQDWRALSEMRLGSQFDEGSRLSAAEQEIESKLEVPVAAVEYNNQPLSQVLDELRAYAGIPIVIDNRALASVRVTSESPVTLPRLDNRRLKSVLNLILSQMELTYVIENDVLMITSMEAKRMKVYPRTYRVTDLVTPIPNFTSSYEDGLAGALRAAYQMTQPQADVHVMPVSMTDLGTGMARSMSPNSINPDVLGQYHSMGSQSGFGMGSPPSAAGGGSFADFQSLIDLIQTTVVPDTWEALGGPSTMAPYPQNLSLVISTTSDVHDQIADLLESLRRLQNLQITIEVRFITLADTFAEQIGVDFNVQVDDNVQRLPDDDEGPSVTVGFDGISGLPTPDLDIRFENGSFGLTPPFGGGGLGTPSTIGFAILSDIEAFFFLQAAQADNRSNVMQAPKVTLFDGQFASINDQSQSPFVISITPVVGDFAVAQQPVIV
ncbi:MAG: DUF4974 domain-containing protein, partial [Planctomycetota bacterium]